MFITLLWGIIFAVFLVNAALVGLAAVGLLWMPFGAFIYAKEGKKRGHSPIRYAVSGAICSLLFYIPWLYVKKWIENKPVPHKNIIWAYAFLYLAWISGPIPFWMALSSSPAGDFSADLIFGGLLALFGLSAILLIYARKQSLVDNGPLPRLPYLLPLIGLYAGYALLVIRSVIAAAFLEPATLPGL